MNKPKTVMLYIILFSTMFLFGFVENVKGVSYPLIKTEFGISYEQQGVMVSILSIGYVLFSILGGILIGRLGIKKPFLMGFALMTIAFLGAFFLHRFFLVAVSLFLILASFGLFELSINALATRIFTVKTALFFNLLHFFYGAGSAVSPLVAGRIASALSWRYAYLFCLPFALLFCIPSILTPFPKIETDEKIKNPAMTSGFLTALKTPMVWAFAITLGLMVSVELSSSNWSGLYFQDVYNLDPKTSGAVFISNFYILFTVSRLFAGFIIEKTGYFRSLFFASFAALVILVIGFSLGAKGIYVLPVLGFFVAIYWPTLLATAAGYFKNEAPVMTSAVIVIAGTLNSVIQFMMGLTNRLIGPAWGYRSALFYSVLIIAALFILVKSYRRFNGQASNS